MSYHKHLLYCTNIQLIYFSAHTDTDRCCCFSIAQEVMEMTSTFKQQKFQLVKSGFNPSTISDPLYVLDYQQEMYIPLTDSIYQSILEGERKL